MTRTVSTGVRVLDRKLDGGIPSGALVTLLAEPASQAELFLAGFVHGQETVYLSTERAPTAVTADLRSQRGQHDDLAVTRLDRDAPVIDAMERLDRLPDECVVVVDPVEALEQASPGQFRAFLEKLRSVLANTGSVAVFYALKHGSTPSQRHRTTYMSDVVFDVVTETDGQSIDTRLYVPKFRGGSALTDPVSLELTDAVSVDTSRDIA